MAAAAGGKTDSLSSQGQLMLEWAKECDPHLANGANYAYAKHVIASQEKLMRGQSAKETTDQGKAKVRKAAFSKLAGRITKGREIIQLPHHVQAWVRQCVGGAPSTGAYPKARNISMLEFSTVWFHEK